MKTQTKTRVEAVEDHQEILITREFDLPLELLFKAYEEPELIEQWMGTKVIRLENMNHGSYQFITTDPRGNKHGFHGVIHEFSPQKRIVRTFEMENASFDPQLEFLEFEKLSDTTSSFRMHIIFKSVEIRDEILKLPFTWGINMAHNRLEEVVSKLKKQQS